MVYYEGPSKESNDCGFWQRGKLAHPHFVSWRINLQKRKTEEESVSGIFGISGGKVANGGESGGKMIDIYKTNSIIEIGSGIHGKEKCRME